MFCSKCGKQNEDGAQFCVQCGNPLVPGAVQGSTKEKLENLYQLARRSRDDNDSENAQKYYEMILPEDPNNWEAAFYSVYFKAMNCKIAQIRSAAISVSNCIDTVLKLIQNYVEDIAAQDAAVGEVTVRCTVIAQMLFTGAMSHYAGIDYSIRDKYQQEMINNCCAARDIDYTLGNQIESIFNGHEALHGFSVTAWKNGINFHKSLMKDFANKELNKSEIMGYADKIKKYEPDYQPPEINTAPSNGGCYVATAVYHSYDCPQVWTLRRFRDDTLAASWYGRAFVRLYYTVSPTLVRWFGETEGFQKLWRGPLGRLVAKLQAQGVEDTPYEDKIW